MIVDRPRARQGLITADHTRRGRRLVTVLDPETLRVTVLEPWEHAVLVLCDGTRDAEAIWPLIPRTPTSAIDGRAVRACFEHFAREAIIETAAVPRVTSVGPRTLAGLQSAYREWHKNPVRTKQILLGTETDPFVDGATVAPPDEDKPAHRVGSVLVAAPVDVDNKSTEEMEAAPQSLMTDEHTHVDTPIPMPHSAAAVFARLRRAGVVARTDPEARDRRGEGRRKNTASSDIFNSGLELLLAGDLEFALDHFKKLSDHMPGSGRVTAFVSAIEAVRRQPAFDIGPVEDPDRVARATKMLAAFEGAIADAVARGQCPSCFAGVGLDDELCPRCRFVLYPDDA